MDARQFVAEFAHVANAPGGVPRLRELILQLAITGRLVQRTSDDTASEFLIKDNLDRQRALVRQGMLKRQPEPRPVDPGSAPWALPEGWTWTRLGSVTNYGDAPKVELEGVTEDTWVLELEDIEKGTSRLLNKVLARDRRFKSTKNGFPSGAVLYGKLRPYLDKVVIADAAGVCTTEISPISFFENIDAGYLRWYLKSPYFIAYADGSTYGMNLPRLGTNDAREALFPFPPKHEQSRIVGKVDELMALCDTLQTQQHSRRKLQNALRQSTVQSFGTATSPYSLKVAWARLEENVQRLFSAPDDVGELRQVVLDLAIGGMLSEPSLGDESVAAFVARCRKGKTNRLASGQLKRKAAAATDVNQLEIVVPPHWGRLSLDELFQFIDYRGKTPAKTERGVVLVTAKNVRPGRLNREPVEYISETSYKHWMRRGFPQVGDILFTTEAPLGNVALIEETPTFALAQRVIDLQPFADLNTRCAMYFMMSPTFQGLLERNSTGMTAKGIKASKLKQLELPVPPVQEQTRIVERVERLMRMCNELEAALQGAKKVAERFAIAAVSELTGITVERPEDEPVKTPQTELIAMLRSGQPPDVNSQAPLATILARHDGEISARDLWQRFGGEIDGFYAQLKTEVAHGWIQQPAVAEVREKNSAAGA